MKRPIVFLIAISGMVIAAGVVAGCGSSASSKTAGPKTAKVLITHVTRGCHDWSVNGSPATASQVAKLAQGGSVIVTDNDVMPHKLVQTKGPATAVVTTPKMAHPGAQAKVSFPRSGVYQFVTKAGEDYPNVSGMETVGPDHTLQLKVVVS